MPAPTRRPALALAGLAAAAVLLLTALGALAAHGGSYARALPRSTPSATSAAPGTRTALPPPPLEPTPSTPPERLPGNAVLAQAVLWTVVALVVAGLVLLAWTLVLNRPQRRLPRGAGAGPAPSGVAAAIPEAVQRALTALEQPDARESVVEAWLLLVAAAAAAGTPARAAETATEYGDRVAAAHGLPGPAVHRLAELYREARFSGHPVGPEQRNAARTELTALQAALGSAAR